MCYVTAIQRLREMLRKRPGDAIPSGLLFSQLDDDAIARDLRLEGKGAERGAAGLPGGDTAGFDDIELEIINRIEGEKHRCTDDFEQQLATYQLRLVSLGIDGCAAAVRAAATETIGAFKAETQQRLNDLTLERDNVIASRRFLDRFRRDHRLDRPAQVPDSHILHFAVILLILVVESVLNGLFFAKGSDYGLLGGASQAFIIALLNVGLAFAAGRGIAPLLNHRSSAVKAIGAAGLTLYVPVAAGYNLAVAHFRDATTAATTAAASAAGFGGADDAARVAIETLLAAPLAVADFESWILFGVGLLFALAALIDGYVWDDPYPGYGRQSRHSRQLHEDYIDKCEAAIEALKEISETSSADLEATLEKVRQHRREYDAALISRARLIRQYRAHLDYLETVANKLLALYRAANARARGASPAPRWRLWTMTRPVVDVAAPSPRSAEHLDRQLADVDAEVKAAAAAVQLEFLRSVEKIKKIEDLDAEPERHAAPRNSTAEPERHAAPQN